MNNRRDLWLMTFGLVVASVFLVYLLHQEHRCTAAGGTYARGLFSMQCIFPPGR